MNAPNVAHTDCHHHFVMMTYKSGSIPKQEYSRRILTTYFVSTRQRCLDLIVLPNISGFMPIPVTGEPGIPYSFCQSRSRQTKNISDTTPE